MKRALLIVCGLLVVVWGLSSVASAASVVPGTSAPIGVEDIVIGEWSYDASFITSTYTALDVEPVLTLDTVGAFGNQLQGLLDGYSWITNENGQNTSNSGVYLPYDDPNVVAGWVRFALVSKAIGTNDWSLIFPSGNTINIATDGEKLWAVVNQQPVPIPGAVWLLGSGLIGIVGIRRRFKR